MRSSKLVIITILSILLIQGILLILFFKFIKVSPLPFYQKLPHGVNWWYAIISENSWIGNLVFQQDDKAQVINYHDKVYIPKTGRLEFTISVCKDTLFGNIGYDCETKKYMNPSCVALLHNKNAFIDEQKQMYIDAQTAASCEIIDITKSPWKRIYYTIEY